MLLSRRADPLARQRDGGTLLHAAALSGPPELARLLLDKGIPVDAKTEAGETALFSAAANGNKETAAVLTGKGADVNARNSQAEGPLFLALKFGHRDVAALLLNAGAKAEGSEKETGRTALHLAAAKGFGAVCSQLLAGDAAVNAVDLAGETPLVLAKRYGNDAIAAALTAKGATLGTAQVRPEPDAGLARPLAEGQAVVWYLGHSGWAVLTRNHFLIFDYAKSGELPDEPSLANGTISPAELKGMNVTVFASHAHGDHYVPAIWEWRKTIPNITYVLGFRPQEKETYSLLKSREKAELNGMEIIPIDSNDSGQGYFVKADGVAIFHPGDHANRQRDFSGPFKGEIDFLADAGLKADILFAPVFGCGFGDLVSVKKGVFYTIDRLSARSVFPMHAGGGVFEFSYPP
jgi:L-ascorbate metabolism protein UlaG (beta-lactamase superfamily)